MGRAEGSGGGRDPSGWIAAALALVAWMGSGWLFPAALPPEPVRAEPPPVAVGTVLSRARPVGQYFVAEGFSRPERDTLIRAEMAGQIAEAPVRRGADLAEGALIARFADAERRAGLARAEAELARALRDDEQARVLLERGVATADRVASAAAILAAAEAGLASAERALAETVLVAPFAGRLDALDIAVGEHVTSGTAIARIIDLDPLGIEVRVPQQSLAAIVPGLAAEVRFITGEVRPGTVRFVGAQADPQTRTFPAEIEVANPDGALAAGLSAQVRIPTGEVPAHFLSPAVLALGTDGGLVVRAVGAGDIVTEHAVEIVRARADGVWVTGLPDEIRLITLGQGFVNAGDRVRPEPDPRLAGPAP